MERGQGAPVCLVTSRSDHVGTSYAFVSESRSMETLILFIMKADEEPRKLLVLYANVFEHYPCVLN